MTWKVYTYPQKDVQLGVNGEGESREQPAKPGSPGKMAVKIECVRLCALAVNDLTALTTFVR